MADFLPPDVREAVASSRVLVVGTGGIGCELVKNLVLTGFTNIDMVRWLILKKAHYNFNFMLMVNRYDVVQNCVCTRGVTPI